MNEYNIFSDIKGALKAVWPFIFTVPFLIYVIPTSSWLIHESAMFIQKAIDYSYAKALIGAALVELGIVFLTVLPVGQKERGKGFIRLILLGVALTVIVGSASKYAVSQYEAQDNIRQADKMKLAAMDDNINSLEKALESVKGQPANSAIASRALQSAIKERQEFVSGLDVDPRLVQSNDQKKWLAVLLRIVLQAVNLYILLALKKSIIKRISMFNAENNAREREREHERENPVVKKSLTTQVFENTEETLKSAQGGKKISDKKPFKKPKNIENMKASELVKYFYPDAERGQVGDMHFIISGNGRNEPLAETKSPGSAWLQAAKKIKQEEGI